jgi:hypothetical protein
MPMLCTLVKGHRPCHRQMTRNSSAPILAVNYHSKGPAKRSGSTGRPLADVVVFLSRIPGRQKASISVFVSGEVGLSWPCGLDMSNLRRKLRTCPENHLFPEQHLETKVRMPIHNKQERMAQSPHRAGSSTCLVRIHLIFDISRNSVLRVRSHFCTTSSVLYSTRQPTEKHCVK